MFYKFNFYRPRLKPHTLQFAQMLTQEKRRKGLEENYLSKKGC